MLVLCPSTAAHLTKTYPLNPDANVCSGCVGDEGLKTLIDDHAQPGKCTYCRQPGKVVSVAWVGERMAEVLRDLHEVTPSAPGIFEKLTLNATGQEWTQRGEPMSTVIAFECAVEDRVALDIEAAIERDTEDRESGELDFGDEPRFVTMSSNPGELEANWGALVRSLQRESRTLTAASRKTLDETFGDIDTQAVFDEDAPVLTIGPNTPIKRLYRARYFQSESTLKDAVENPTVELAPPPGKLVTAGRMNFPRISVFYGALARRTAVEEVRPPLGSWVLTGAFRLTRALRVLDIGSLRNAYSHGSSFSPDAVARRDKAAFLRNLCERLVVPVMPDDQADEFLPTQVIAEYLAQHPRLQLDGLKYPSVQGAEDGACNVVLFHKNARVGIQNAKQVDKVQLYHHDIPSESLAPLVWLTPGSPKPPEEARPCDASKERGDWREVTLELNLGSLKVHKVSKVRYRCSAAPVSFEQLAVPSDFSSDL